MELLKIYAILSLLIHCTASGDKLAKALLDDMIPPSSSKCDFQGSGSTDFTMNFSSLNTFSNWHAPFKDYERALFLAQLEHANSNKNLSWRIRISSGGNMYSLVGPFGESVPPQAHKDAPFIDEVWQSVAVDQAKQRNASLTGYQYFIHQAGSYMRDGTFTAFPFYSPSIALNCEGRQCSFASWGQHGHVPSIYKSRALYFNRYRDCGEGVLEFTSIIHNSEPKVGGGSYEYVNMPWGGVRRSSLTEVLVSDQAGGPSKIASPPSFFSTADRYNIIPITSTGGFLTFSQDLYNPDPPDFAMPCPDAQSNAQPQCPSLGPYNVSLRLVIAYNSPCVESAGHTAAWGAYTVSCAMRTTVAVKSNCLSCDLLFLNNRTGESVAVRAVIAWAITSDKITYFSLFQPSNCSASCLNKIFFAGDNVTVQYLNVGSKPENALSLVYVFGKTNGKLNSTWKGGGSFISRAMQQWGRQSDLNRDYTVYTNFLNPSLKPECTLVTRQFLLIGPLTGMDERAKALVAQSHSGVFGPGEVAGRAVRLHATDGSKFGATVAGDRCATGEMRCEGRTTPQSESAPFFYVVCGNRSYMGPDPYSLSPAPTVPAGLVRPYVCHGQPLSIRPKVTLLGFFKSGSCPELVNSTYDNAFCDEPTSAQDSQQMTNAANAERSSIVLKSSLESTGSALGGVTTTSGDRALTSAVVATTGVVSSLAGLVSSLVRVASSSGVVASTSGTSVGVASSSGGIASTSAASTSAETSSLAVSSSAGVAKSSTRLASTSGEVALTLAGVESTSGRLSTSSTRVASTLAVLATSSTRVSSSSEGVAWISGGVTSSSEGVAWTSGRLASSSAGLASTKAGVASTLGGLASTSAGLASTSGGVASTSVGVASSSGGVASTLVRVASTSAGIVLSSAGMASTSVVLASSSDGSTSSSVVAASSSGGVATSSTTVASSSAEEASSSWGLASSYGGLAISSTRVASTSGLMTTSSARVVSSSGEVASTLGGSTLRLEQSSADVMQTSSDEWDEDDDSDLDVSDDEAVLSWGSSATRQSVVMAALLKIEQYWEESRKCEHQMKRITPLPS